ncbi:MAG TPA: hypothetical protein P5338_07515, partial [Bacteroidales bacterium]|nr:hypothetical protein [Bacteroidales bacterium]
SSAKVFYWVMLANGSPSLPEAEKYKRYYGHLEIQPIDGMAITLYTDYQARASKPNAFSPGNNLANGILTSAFFVGFQEKDRFSVGFEAYCQMTENGTKFSHYYDNTNGYGLSVFGTLHFLERWNVFARIDQFEPNSGEFSLAYYRTLFIGGLACKPAENLLVSGNVLVEAFEEPFGYRIESSVTPRITLSWTF